MRKIFIPLAAAVLGLGFMAAPPAQAEQIHFQMKTDDGNPGGSVHFWPGADMVDVCDIQHDDDLMVHVSVINVTKDPNVVEYRLEDGGDITCAAKNGYDGQPWQLAEGHCFQFQIWLHRPGIAEIHDGTFDTAQWRNYNHAKQECDGVD